MPAVIVGAGQGIGRSVALRFAREGLSVALISRNAPGQLADEVASTGVPALALSADSAEERELVAALSLAEEQLGPPDVLVYNAAIIQADLPGELPARGHLEAWAVNVAGALTSAAYVAPGMEDRGSGSIIITGGMPEPDPRYTSLSLGKAGVRTLVSLLDKQFGPAGVHVATVTVAGVVAPGTAYDPDDIAEQYWRLHTQEPGEWLREVVHG